MTAQQVTTQWLHSCVYDRLYHCGCNVRDMDYQCDRGIKEKIIHEE